MCAGYSPFFPHSESGLPAGGFSPFGIKGGKICSPFFMREIPQRRKDCLSRIPLGESRFHSEGESMLFYLPDAAADLFEI
ncbi:MAG: hypothetical protein DBX55_02815 [Verrucomicrobia bacterium]|nr:MAG: hypothetical protein DBX55_02815 [Verrucomicrobiota bacterium]